MYIAIWVCKMEKCEKPKGVLQIFQGIVYYLLSIFCYTISNAIHFENIKVNLKHVIGYICCYAFLLNKHRMQCLLQAWLLNT